MDTKNVFKPRSHATEEVQFFQGPMRELTKRPTLLCLSGVQSGVLLHLQVSDRPFVVGRDGDVCDLYIDSPEISRHHAHIEMRSDQQLYVVDLNSTNGVFVNNQKVSEQRLEANDKIRLGPHSLWKFFYQDLEEYEYYQQLYANASEDYLTGALNRRSFLGILSREISFAIRHQRRVTLVLCDIDFFKKINDTHGHLVGDQILREFVQRLKQSIRQEDILARYGGEEFVLLLREIQPEQSVILIERLRQKIADSAFQTSEGFVPVTMSVGAVTYHHECLKVSSALELLQRPDELLYQAKERGRNCVVHETLSV